MEAKYIFKDIQFNDSRTLHEQDQRQLIYGTITSGYIGRARLLSKRIKGLSHSYDPARQNYKFAAHDSDNDNDSDNNSNK